MITALLCLLESKQDNGCFLQKMKQSFDSWFHLEMMRGTHPSQPLPFFHSSAPDHLSQTHRSAITLFFNSLSAFLSSPFSFPSALSSLCFCQILLSSILLSVFVLQTNAHTHSHLSNWVWLQSCTLSSHTPLRCQISSARKRGKYEMIICTGCK